MKDFDNEEMKRVFSDPNHFIREDEIKKSVILLPLVEIDGRMQILFEVRSPNIAQGLEVCFPGGRREVFDVNDEMTGVRETMEELGIEEEKIEILGDLGSLMNDSQQYIHGFVGRLKIHKIEELRPDLAEVQEIFAVPLDFFMQNKAKNYEISIHMQSRFQDENGEEVVLFPARELNLPERYHSKWRVRKRKIYLFEYKEYKIWGITAAFLVDFCERLKKSGLY